MKTFFLALLLTTSALAVTFSYNVEHVPDALPGASLISDGVMVFVSEDAQVCVSFLDATGAAGAMCGAAIDDGYGYSVVKLDVGAGVTVTNIAIADKSVDNPQPGILY